MASNQPVNEQRVQTACMLILAAIGVALTLYWMRPVLVPFVLALFISVGLSALADLLVDRLRFPRKLAVSATLVFGVFCLLAVGAVVSSSVAQISANANAYRDNVGKMLNSAANWLVEHRIVPGAEEGGKPREEPAEEPGPQPAVAPQPVAGPAVPESADHAPEMEVTEVAEAVPPSDAPVTAEVGYSAPADTETVAVVPVLTVPGLPASPAARAVAAEPDPVKRLLRVPVEAVGGLLMSTTGAIANILSNGLLVIIFICFLMFGGSAGRPTGDGTWAEILEGTRRYIVTKVLISGTTGILVGCILSMLGVELALMFGLMAFLLNFIPSIGSIIATILPLPVVLLSDIPPAAKIMAIALPGAVQFLIGNVAEPRVMGKSMNLHPIVVLMSLIFWGLLWGIVGMFLAVPMASVMRILLEKLEITQPLARLMAGQPSGQPPDDSSK